MKEGDWVKKVGGDYDLSRVGLVLKVQTNDVNTTIVTVYVGNEIKSWAGHLVEVIGHGPKIPG
jgi:hypothetical protein